jgi:hypothetical protein
MQTKEREREKTNRKIKRKGEIKSIFLCKWKKHILETKKYNLLQTIDSLQSIKKLWMKLYVTVVYFVSLQQVKKYIYYISTLFLKK